MREHFHMSCPLLDNVHEENVLAIFRLLLSTEVPASDLYSIVDNKIYVSSSILIFDSVHTVYDEKKIWFL